MKLPKTKIKKIDPVEFEKLANRVAKILREEEALSKPDVSQEEDDGCMCIKCIIRGTMPDVGKEKKFKCDECGEWVIAKGGRFAHGKFEIEGHTCKPLKEKECICDLDKAFYFTSCPAHGCTCECHKDGWGGKKHLGYYQDTCPCQPPSPIKGECEPENHKCDPLKTCDLMKEQEKELAKDLEEMASPQPQSEDLGLRDKISETIWEELNDEAFFIPIEALNKASNKILDLLKSQREEIISEFKPVDKNARQSYQQEIVGKIKGLRASTFQPVGGMSNIEYISKRDVFAILEQEKE